MKKTNGFGLFGVILIMIITALISSIATGVIMLNSSVEINNNGLLIEDKYLNDFIKVYETIVNKYYDEIDKKGMLDAAESGMLNFLGDKYTTFLENEEYNEILNELSATYNGIGILIENNKIVEVTKDSPAEKAGIQNNDIILKINNIDTTNLIASEIGEIIKKDKEPVNMLINRNGVELNFYVEKADLINVAIDYSKLENTNIGYLKIKKFSDNLDIQVSEALKELENIGIKSLIIDVRNNVGGYLSAAENTSSLFLKSGKTIYSLQTSTTTIKYKDETKENRDYNIVVLINNNSASAAEILAAALKESYGATLVGTKTYGKGKVQQIVGESAKYTFAKWLTPNGICIDGIGISPDYYVSNITEDTIDYQLNKAIELLS